MEKVITSIIEKEKDEENINLLNKLKGSLRGMTTSKKKRSLLPFVGKILNGLFGVAVEGDVEREKERLDKMEKWASEYGHVINNVVDSVNDQLSALNEIVENLNNLETKVEFELDLMQRRVAIQQIVIEMENIKDDLMNKFEGMLMANKGIVTMSLLSPRQVQEVIEYSIVNFAFKPLEIDLITYYHLMNVKVVHDTCFVLLPFNSDQNLYANHIIPFPMKIEEENLIIDHKEILVLENNANNLISVWDNKELENCVMITNGEYICNKEDYYLQPMNNFPCIKFLLHEGRDGCEYKHFQKDFYVELLDKIYVFTNESLSTVVSCKKKKERKLLTNNINIFPRECDVKIIDKFYYSPGIFQSVDIHDIDEVENNFQVNMTELKLPRFKINVKPLKEFNGNILYVYKEKVMPIFTILMMPIIILVIVVICIIVKKLLINKVNELSDILKGLEGK